MKNKAANVRRYNTNETFRAEVQKRAASRYQSNTESQQKMKNISKRSYQSSETARKKKKETVGNNRTIKKLKLQQEEKLVRQFKEKTMEGPDYVCACCCQRILFRKQVQGCEQQMYDRSDVSKEISEICLQEKYLHTCSESCPKMCTKSSL